MAIEAFLGPAYLEDVVGTAVERNGVVLLPLPHPSGVSRWLNDPAHQALLERGLQLLAGLRERWAAEAATLAAENEIGLPATTLGGSMQAKGSENDD